MTDERKSRNEIKAELLAAVALKVSETQQRLALKRIPFAQRTPEQHRAMLDHGRKARILKEQIRVVQLAYVLVRGRPYWTQERYTIHPAKPSAPWIAQVAGASKEEVLAWLEAPVDAAARACFRGRVGSGKAGGAASSSDRSPNGDGSW